MEKPEDARRLGVEASPYSANSDAQARRSQRLRTDSGEGWGAERSFWAQRSHCLSSPASSSCSRSQTTGCAAGALHPLAFSLFRFRPALHSPPISLSVWERGHLRGRRLGSSASLGCCLRCCHLLRQAGVCGGPRGGGGSGGSDMEPEAGGRSSARRHGAGPPSTPPPREQERKLEQEKLSGVVKSVHRRLRKKYREGKQRA